MELNVAVAFGPDRVCRLVCRYSPVALFRTHVGTTPNMIDGRVFGQSHQITNRLIGGHPGFTASLRRWRDEFRPAFDHANDENSFTYLWNSIVHRLVKLNGQGITKIRKISDHLLQRIMTAFHQQRPDVFRHEYLGPQLAYRSYHRTIEAAPSSTHPDALAIYGNILARKATNDNISLPGKLGNELPNITTMNCFTQISLVSATGGFIEVVCPNNLEGKLRVTYAKYLESAAEAQIHPSTTGEHRNNRVFLLVPVIRFDGKGRR